VCSARKCYGVISEWETPFKRPSVPISVTMQATWKKNIGFESIVSSHLLVEYVMEKPLLDEKKRKIVAQNNVSTYYINGV
jgi:hypothetical protein